MEYACSYLNARGYYILKTLYISPINFTFWLRFFYHYLFPSIHDNTYRFPVPQAAEGPGGPGFCCSIWIFIQKVFYSYGRKRRLQNIYQGKRKKNSCE